MYDLNKLIPPNELTNEAYHAINSIDGVLAISASGLKQANKDPKLYYNKSRLLAMPSPSKELGSALHEAVLEPESFSLDSYTLTPANKTKFEIMKNNFLVMFDYLLPNTLKEHSLFVKDNGFIRKVRPDIYNPKKGEIYDIKTTKATTPDEFEKDLFRLGYHLQASFYIDTLRLAGFKANAFGFLCVPNDSPCEPFAVQLSSEFIELGRESYTNAVQKVLEYSNARNQAYFHTATMPKWLREQLGY